MQTTFRQILKTAGLKVYLVYFLFASLLYLGTQQARFVHDFIGWAVEYDQAGLAGLPALFSRHGLLPVYHGVFFSMYKLFGTSPWPWHIMAMALYAGIASLIFSFCRKVLDGLSLPSLAPSIIAGMLFLLCPFNTEAVIWGATIHYLLCGLLMIAALNIAYAHLQEPSNASAVLLPLLTLTALFTLEYALVLPFMLIALALIIPSSLPNIKAALRMGFPQLAILCLYFLINYLAIGKFFGHYGGAPVSDINPAGMAANFGKYMGKFIFYTPYWKYPHKEWLNNLLDKPALSWAIFALLLTGSIALLVRSFSMQAKYKWLIVLFFIFGLALVPTLPMYFLYLFPNSNDRYGFIPYIFFCPLLVVSIAVLLPKVKYVVLSGYVLISAIFLIIMMGFWRISGDVRMALINDFHWQNAPKVYVLAAPDNIHGIMLFADEHAVAENLYVYNKGKLPGNVRQVMLTKISDADDSVKVQVLNDSTISIGLGQDGSWFMREGQGGTSYETPEYRVEMQEYSYNFIIRQPRPGDVYIYSVDDKWKEVKFP